MNQSLSLSAALTVSLSMLLLGQPIDSAAQSPDPSHLHPDASECSAALSRAFELRFDQSSAEEVTITRRHGDETEEIRIQSARKFIQGRMHSVVRFLSPSEYRGWRTLSIENHDRSDDHFIFMRSLNRVKRVRAEPADAFFATDFSLEDMERRTGSDYIATNCSRVDHDGERAWKIETAPAYATAYVKAEFFIGVEDHAQLAARYYKKGSRSPSKEILFPRSDIDSVGGIPVAKLIVVRSTHRRTETHARVDRIIMNPDLPNALFSTTALEVDRAIPGL